MICTVIARGSSASIAMGCMSTMVTKTLAIRTSLPRQSRRLLGVVSITGKRYPGVTAAVFPHSAYHYGRRFSRKDTDEVIDQSVLARSDTPSKHDHVKTANEDRNVDDSTSTTSTATDSSQMSLAYVKPTGWRKRMQRRAGVALSAAGFVSSATRALLTDRRQQWKPTVEALRNFLNTSGIYLELSALLNVRLLDNLIILSRVEQAALKGMDRRDLACRTDASPMVAVPSAEEALRFVVH
jgi:hypothetical protein